jgi:hypothetical protein
MISVGSTRRARRKGFSGRSTITPMQAARSDRKGAGIAAGNRLVHRFFYFLESLPVASRRQRIAALAIVVVAIWAPVAPAIGSYLRQRLSSRHARSLGLPQLVARLARKAASTYETIGPT